MFLDVCLREVYFFFPRAYSADPRAHITGCTFKGARLRRFCTARARGNGRRRARRRKRWSRCTPTYGIVYRVTARRAAAAGRAGERGGRHRSIWPRSRGTNYVGPPILPARSAAARQYPLPPAPPRRSLPFRRDDSAAAGAARIVSRRRRRRRQLLLPPPYARTVVVSYSAIFRLCRHSEFMYRVPNVFFFFRRRR